VYESLRLTEVRAGTCNDVISILENLRYVLRSAEVFLRNSYHAQDTCLNAPGISGEARFIILRLFKHIQETFRKRLFDGYSIDPGTVLRFDGTTSSDEDISQLSATFVCFPYLSLGERPHMFQPAKHEYPTRSLLQTLYPYESTGNREVAPGFCKAIPRLSDHVLYVPQCWAVIIGSRKFCACMSRRKTNLS
jgi:hypothetical protein